MTIQPHRGIVAAFAAGNPNDPRQVLAELSTAFSDFQRRTEADIQAALQGAEEANQRIAALTTGAAGPLIQREGDLTEVSAALRAFIGQGDEGAMAKLVGGPQAGMSSDINPDGGYLTVPTLGTAMSKKIWEISPMRQLARIVTITGNEYEEIADIGEADAGWVGERDARPDTASPIIGKLSVPVAELYACPKVTQRLLDDSSIDLATWIIAKCSTQFARKEGAAFINGDGAAKPRGLLSYPTATTSDATRSWGTLQYLKSGVAAALSDSSHNGADVLIDLTYSVKAAYRANASWLMNRATAAEVRKLKDANGRFLWTDSLKAGEPPMLLGFPVHLDEEMPDIAAGAFPIAFGDFQEAYLIVDRHGLRLLRDPFTDKPNVRFYTYKRTGGALSNSEAVKLLKISA